MFNSDFSPVTDANPARGGETLIIRARGLGPTRPGVDPGVAFPEMLQEVNSPVEVLVGGRPAVVVNKVGWPGQANVYRVDFRVPDGVVAGRLGVQLVAGWTPSAEVQIPVR
jgi:uncharacterized protein (TIGR03437 family)